MSSIFNNKYFFLALPLFIIFSFVLSMSSCKTKKTKKVPVSNIQAADSLYIKLNENQFSYNTLEARFSANVEFGGKVQSFNANMRIQKDSIIWMSISPFLGIELVRLLITQDSVKLINRIDNTYYLSNVEYLNNLFNADVDFNILQAALTGNNLNFYSDNNMQVFFKDNQVLFTLNDRMHTNQVGKSRRVNHNIIMDAGNYRILQQTFFDNQENYKFELTYSNFKKENETDFPYEINATTTTKSETTNISIKYTRITTDKDITFPFTVPDKYKKLP